MRLIRTLRAVILYALPATLIYSMLGLQLALAEQHALLIGAANYQNKAITSLKGPPNDVTLIWRALTKKRGFSNADVIVYAGDLPSGPDFPVSLGDATKNAILNGL